MGQFPHQRAAGEDDIIKVGDMKIQEFSAMGLFYQESIRMKVTT